MPRDPWGYENITESTDVPRESLPEKANAFGSHLLTRFGRASK